MIRLEIREAQTGLARYLPRLEAGETLLLCNDDVPVAEIRPLPAKRTTERPIRLGKGQIVIPGSFFDPLP